MGRVGGGWGCGEWGGEEAEAVESGGGQEAGAFVSPRTAEPFMKWEAIG